ncbi:hypothetical protein [Nocardioides dongxiaopingii]|uniref:hypothetical protein n=1 Tax=Nocardioides dongxiaopingii TaxID=2576036 RepID=UPI0010C7619A|nr:hypothetical protein [Nocardioides dongxiaopingii]
MTGTVTNHTGDPRGRHHRARRLLTVAGAAGVLVAGSAGAASADVPEGWDTPPSIDTGFALLILVGVPVGLFLLITLLTYLPAMIRGERLAPGGQVPEDQWLGGPRRSPNELAAPDTAESRAGGSSARW